MKIPDIRYKTPPPKGDNILPVIIPVLNRLDLLQQTLMSLVENSHHEVWPIIIDGGSDDDTREFLEHLEELKIIRLYRMYIKSGVGVCRNFGAAVAPFTHKYIYFSDGDVYFTKGWDKKLIESMEEFPDIGVIGGQKHPYHGVQETLKSKKNPGHTIQISDQQAGYSLMLRREVWLQVGPYRSSGPDDIGVEDADLCNRVRDAGYKVASLEPEVIVHTGLERSNGTDTIAAHFFKDMKQKYPDILIK